MFTYKKIIILYNPKSTGNSSRNAKQFAKRLERAGCKDVLEVVPSKYRGHARELCLSYASKFSPIFVISSSGDGAYNEVINGALEAQANGAEVVTGLLASGNANDHYKAMHRPFVTRRIKAGKSQAIDVLSIESTVNGKPWQRYAHSYIGFGITPEVGQALNEADLNPANELVIAFKNFVDFNPSSVIIHGKKETYTSLVISNIGRMSKWAKLSKHAKVDDGLFEVTTWEASKAKAITGLVKSVTVGLPHEEQLKSIKIKSIESLMVQLDGEVFTIDSNSDVQIKIVPHALNCII